MLQSSYRFVEEPLTHKYLSTIKISNCEIFITYVNIKHRPAYENNVTSQVFSGSNLTFILVMSYYQACYLLVANSVKSKGVSKHVKFGHQFIFVYR